MRPNFVSILMIAKYMALVSLVSFNISLDLDCFAQSTSRNYVLTRTMLDEQGAESTSSIVYYDGLGRPLLAIDESCSSQGAVAVFTEYGTLGEVSKAWLPIPATSLDYIAKSDGAAAAQAFYSDSHPYSENINDALGRPVEAWGPGSVWRQASKAVHSEYGTNAANSVKKYSVASNANAPSLDGYYSPGTLTSVKVTDEDGRTVETFKDMRGNVVLVRRAGSNDTYYVYNNIGQLAFVLQPEYGNDPDASRYAFAYEYDALGNLSKKSMPGCEPTRYWYDVGRRVAFEQDPVLADNGLMRFYLYDNLGRCVVRGTCNYFAPPSTISASAAFSVSEPSFGGYARQSGPTLANVRLESVSYYDGYAFIEWLGNAFPSRGTDRLNFQSASSAKGLQTGTLAFASNGEPMFSAMKYDEKGRLTNTASIGLDGVFVETETEYDFSGRIASSACSIEGGPSFERNVAYCTGSSLMSSQSARLTVGNAVCQGLVGTYAYDGVGRLASVGRGQSIGDLSYSYNLRGWQTEVSGPAFEERLYYAEGVSIPMYSSLISGIEWTTTDRLTRSYDYAYDELGQLVSARYAQGMQTVMPLSADMNSFVFVDFSEYVDEYSANGQIKRLRRYGDTGRLRNQYGLVDDLQLEYDGNRLVKVTDSAAPVNWSGSMDFDDGADMEVEFQYNGAGALVSDANKGISNIEYDDSGYPRLIQFDNGNQTQYVYSPDGVKLKEKHFAALEITGSQLVSPQDMPTMALVLTDSIDYVGDFVYRNGELRMCRFDGGYFGRGDDGAGDWKMHYYTCDHIGNIRAVVDEDGELLQTMDYYPFGGIYSCSNPEVQPFSYSGKELDRMHGLNWYDFGFRSYDPATGSWTSTDPLAEKTPQTNQYVFCGNNPVNFIDREGLEIRGVTQDDAKLAVADIRSMFSDDIFGRFRDLIRQSGKKNNGKSLATIDSNSLSLAFEGISLSEDQQALVDIVVNTINSKDRHLVEYTNMTDFISSEAQENFRSEFSKLFDVDQTVLTNGGVGAFVVNRLGGEGLTVFPNKRTSHSIILKDVFHPNGQAATTGHEIFGHGRSHAAGNGKLDQHEEAIKTENLILRVMGRTTQRNGSDHGNGNIIQDYKALPSYR